jgi:hypothetical protein
MATEEKTLARAKTSKQNLQSNMKLSYRLARTIPSLVIRARPYAKRCRPLLFALCVFGLVTEVHAVSPPPDGGYPGGNTAEGQNALFSRTTGGFNTAVGLFSLRALTAGSNNTGLGAATLLVNIADNNTAAGTGALLSNTTGANNTATGAFALVGNNQGSRDNAFASLALASNTNGSFNNAFGTSALLSNTTGNANNAFGDEALRSNINGIDNTAIGDLALHNCNGNANTAAGAGALSNNASCTANTAVGAEALQNDTGFGYNTAVGTAALINNTTGDTNSALGNGAGSSVTTASNVICIGSPGDNADGTTWIGGIYGTTTVSGTTLPVVVSDGGQLGAASSSKRFKREIRPMDRGSEAILALKPVMFHYRSDKTNSLQFGLIAEEVAEVNPDLVVCDKEGEVYTVRYDAVNAMLLNEFLKEHRKVQQLEKQVKKLTAGLRNVSNQLEPGKSQPHFVLDSR